FPPPGPAADSLGPGDPVQLQLLAHRPCVDFPLLAADLAVVTGVRAHDEVPARNLVLGQTDSAIAVDVGRLEHVSGLRKRHRGGGRDGKTAQSSDTEGFHPVPPQVWNSKALVRPSR